MDSKRVIAFSRLCAMMPEPPTESRLMRIAAFASGKGPSANLPGLVLIAGGQTYIGGLRSKLRVKMEKFHADCGAKLSESVTLHAKEYLEKYPNGSEVVDDSMLSRVGLMTVGFHLTRCIEHLFQHALETEDLRFLKKFNSLLEQTTDVLSGDFYSMSMYDAYALFLNIEQNMSTLLNQSGLPGYALAFQQIIRARGTFSDGRPAPTHEIARLVTEEWNRLRGSSDGTS